MCRPIVSIVTATHNRSDLLKRLYSSLCEQSNKTFEWIVVNDDSSDNTIEVLNSFDDSIFPIIKRTMSHGGKHRAVNKGVQYAKGFLTLIVDDDDWLLPNAIEIILEYHQKYKDTKKICGYSFLRQYPDGVINTNEFSKDVVITSYVQARINSKIRNAIGDRAEVYFTDILKDNPFPEFDGEYFYSEDGLWVRLSEKYDMVHIRKPIYSGDYLQDGLTNNGRKSKLSSPQGMIDRTNAFLSSSEHIRLYAVLKMTILWLTYNFYLEKKALPLILSSKKKTLTLFCIPFAKILLKKWKSVS